MSIVGSGRLSGAARSLISRGAQLPPGEQEGVFGSLLPTHAAPTLTRRGLGAGGLLILALGAAPASILITFRRTSRGSAASVRGYFRIWEMCGMKDFLSSLLRSANLFNDAVQVVAAIHALDA